MRLVDGPWIERDGEIDRDLTGGIDPLLADDDAGVG
jgi:hypothetical protein